MGRHMISIRLAPRRIAWHEALSKAAVVVPLLSAHPVVLSQDAGEPAAVSLPSDGAKPAASALSLIDAWVASRPRRSRASSPEGETSSGTGLRPALAARSAAGPAGGLPTWQEPPDDRWSLVGVLKLFSSAAASRNSSQAGPARPRGAARVTRSSGLIATADTPAATAAGFIDASAQSSGITTRSAVGLGGLAGGGRVYATLVSAESGPQRMDATVMQVSRGSEATEAAVFRMLNAGESSSAQAMAIDSRMSALGMSGLQVSFGNADRAAFTGYELVDVPLPSAFGFSRGRYVSVAFSHADSAHTRLSLAAGTQGTGSSSTLAIARSHPLGETTRVSAGLSTTMENNQITGAVGEGLFDTSGQHVRSTAIQLGVTTRVGPLQLRSWAEVLATHPTRLNGAIDGITAQTAMAAGVSARWSNLALTGDALALAFTLPARTVSGQANIVSASQDEDGNPSTYVERVSLRPAGMERVVSLSYSRALTKEMKIQAGSMLRLEPDHVADAKPEVAVGVKLVFRLK